MLLWFLCLLLFPSVGLAAREGGGEGQVGHSNLLQPDDRNLVVVPSGRLHVERSGHAQSHLEVHGKDLPTLSSSLASIRDPQDSGQDDRGQNAGESDKPPPSADGQAGQAPTEDELKKEAGDSGKGDDATLTDEELKQERTKFTAIGFGVGASFGVLALFMRGSKSADVPAEGTDADLSAGLPKDKAEDPAPNEESSEHVVLDDQIKELKRKKGRVLMDQAMSKRKLENITQAILTAEAEIEARSAPSQEEVLEKAKASIANADQMSEKKLLNILAYIAPVAIQGRRLAATIDKRTEMIKEKATQLAYEESMNAINDLGTVFGAGTGDVFQHISNIEMPALTTLVASAFAPAQLKLLLANNYTSTVQSLVFALLSVFCLTWNHLRTDDICHSAGWGNTYVHRQLMLWYTVDAATGCFCFLVRFFVIRIVRSALEDLEKPIDIQEFEDNPVKALRAMLEYYMTTGVDALNSYNAIIASFMYHLANATVLFDTAWMIYACDIMLNTSWSHCAMFSLGVLRFRCCVFLILLIPNLIPVTFFFVERFLMSEAFQIQILTAAHMVDNSLWTGIPIAVVLAHAWLVRNQRLEMTRLEIRMNEVQLEQLKEKREEMERAMEEYCTEEKTAQDNIDSLQVSLRAEKEQSGSDDTKAKQEKEQILIEAEELFVKVNEQAHEGAVEAKSQVQEWERGDGPEFVQALSKGEGYQAVQEYFSKLDVNDLQKLALEHAAAVQDSDLYKQAVEQATLAADAGQQAVKAAANDDSVQAAMAQASAYGEAGMASALDNENMKAALAQAEETKKAALDNENMKAALAQAGETKQAAINSEAAVTTSNTPAAAPVKQDTDHLE